jgi:hypothetical protein
MTTWIYLPVPTQEMRDFASGLALGSQYTLSNYFVSGKGKAVTRFFGGCLGGVAAWDELLLICHGATGGSRFTGASRGANNELKKYSPDELAVVLRKEGLTKSFVDLKLLVCGGGLRPASGLDDPFAERVCAALKAEGYSQIRVTGYLGDVSTSGGKITVLRNGEQGGKYYDGKLPASYKVYK